MVMDGFSDLPFPENRYFSCGYCFIHFSSLELMATLAYYACQGSPERQQWRTRENSNRADPNGSAGANWYHWRVVVDDRRTLQPLEIPLLIKIHKKRSMGWLIALDEPIFNKPTKISKPANSTPYCDYVI